MKRSHTASALVLVVACAPAEPGYEHTSAASGGSPEAHDDTGASATSEAEPSAGERLGDAFAEAGIILIGGLIEPIDLLAGQGGLALRSQRGFL
jgi:hypothetical protein